MFAACSVLPLKLVLSAVSLNIPDPFYLRLGDLTKYKTMLSHLTGRVVPNILVVFEVSVPFCDITIGPIFQNCRTCQNYFGVLVNNYNKSVEKTRKMDFFPFP